MSGHLTRRALLRRSAAAAALTAVGIAGCSGTGNRAGTTAEYAQWLPAPGEDASGGRYGFGAYDLAALAAEREHLGGEPAVYERAWRPLSLGWRDASAVVTVGPVTAARADFERDAAASTLEAEDYDAVGTHRGYALYSRADDARAFGLAGGTLLVADDGQFEGSATPADRIRAVVDTRDGALARYPEADETARTLVDALGEATLLDGMVVGASTRTERRSGRFENLLARGHTATIDGETASVRWLYVYDRPRDVDLDALRAYVAAARRESGQPSNPFDGVGDVGYEKSGRIARITGRREADWYFRG